MPFLSDLILISNCFLKPKNALFLVKILRGVKSSNATCSVCFLLLTEQVRCYLQKNLRQK